MRRMVTWFLVGALPGFVLNGYMSLAAIRHSQGLRAAEYLGEISSRAVIVGLLGNLVFGTPGALVFGLAMRKAKAGVEWLVAGAVATGLALPIGYVFVWFVQEVWMRGDGSYISNPVPFFLVASVATFGGAILGTLKGRSNVAMSMAASQSDPGVGSSASSPVQSPARQSDGGAGMSERPVPSEKCPYCGEPAFAGATRCVACWKEIRRA